VTVAEKIIAAHVGRPNVAPGETLLVPCDLAVGSEIIFPQILITLNELGWNKSVLSDKIAVVNGHLVPTREAAAGTLVAALDRFATQHFIQRYYQAGRSGDCQSLLAEQGVIKPGQLVVGSDQHFTTYGAVGALATGVGGIDLASIWTTGKTWLTVPLSARVILHGKLLPHVKSKDLALNLLALLGTESVRDCSIEFSGDGLKHLTMPDRFTICNLMIETGAQFSWMPVDDTTRTYLARIDDSLYDAITPDPDACYSAEYHVEMNLVPPMIAKPWRPTEAIPVDEAGVITVNQVIIGSCTNGRIEDFRMVAAMLKNREIHEGVRLGLYPSSHQAVRDMVDDELALFFTRRGASISPPSCQPCLGSGPSLLGEGEVGLYTTNRNYRGRHGPESAKVYLCGPLVATASAITGVITNPREFI